MLSVLWSVFLWGLLMGVEGQFREPRAALNKAEFEGKLNNLTDEAWLQDVLKTHNILRERHGSKPLELDYKLSYEAQQWADTLVNWTDVSKTITYKHSSPKGQGENIGMRNTKEQDDFKELLKTPGSWPTTSWYKEIKDHNYKGSEMSPKSGHFTQVVWAGTKQVGCGRSASIAQKVIFVVCRYLPPGNTPNNKASFEANVKPPTDKSDANAVPDFGKLKIQTT